MSVKSAIGEYGNPFLETSSDILVLDTRDIVEKSGVYNVYRMESQGCQQYYNLMLDGPAMLCVLEPAASGTLSEYACPGCVPTLCGT